MANVDALIEQLSAKAAPVAQARHPYVQCLKWVTGFAVYLAFLVWVFPMRPDLAQKLQSPLFVAELAALALVNVTAALSCALLGFPDLMQKKALTFAPLVAFIAFVVIMLLAYHADSPPAPAPEHEMLCTLCITLFSLMPAAWLFASMRKAASTHAGLSGYIATLCAFSIGGLVLRLSEQTDSISHLLQWHYIPMLLMSMAGIALGKLLLKW